ncbi:MAG: DUF222 domain-containing protein [Actinobacteria bacterium]|nr:DUF222 domain-containing protein [Actinomycetota bacterium]
MFDTLPPEAFDVLDDDALVGAIAGWARASAAADGRRLAAIAELVRRRCTDAHPTWACDDWDAAAAELACVLTVSDGRASGQMDLAVTLRDRLPRVGALLLRGEVDTRTATSIAARTALVTDPGALAELDSVIAERATAWGPLSKYKLEQAVDVWVDSIDPGALRRTRNSVRGRDFTIGHPNDQAGTTSVFGRLATPDAALLGERLKAMVHGVCDDDPRTSAQRRADAIGALGAGSTHLSCRCGAQTCPAADDDGRASSVVVHVIAEKPTADAPPDPHLDGEGPAPDTSGPPGARAALIPGSGGGIVPAPLVAALIAHGATITPVRNPAPGAQPRYRPSTVLDEWVRMRDLTCRHPGCDRPAVSADIDHTVPYPAGPTHPANLKCYCRTHHLVKTFWPGWTDRQRADGTMIVTTPSGRSYTTRPGSSLFFPNWDTTLAEPAGAPVGTGPTPVAPDGLRGLKMPTRARTRARVRAGRLARERAVNDAVVGERNMPPPL